jgi:hypothetical protein
MILFQFQSTKRSTTKSKFVIFTHSRQYFTTEPGPQDQIIVYEHAKDEKCKPEQLKNDALKKERTEANLKSDKIFLEKWN